MHEEIYRAAASVMVFRPAEGGGGRSGGEPQFLLLHKPRKRDAWQLPQGGVEAGETSEQAALRELGEEAGLHDVRLIGRSSEVYQYDFPASFRRFRPDHVKGQRIEYFFAVAQNDQFKVDGVEIDKAVWVTARQLPGYVRRRPYLVLMRRLLAEGIPLLNA